MDPVLAGIAAVIVVQIVILGVVLNIRGLVAKSPKISPAPSASGPEPRPQPRPEVPFQKRRDPYPPQQQPSRPRPEAPVRPPVAAPTAAPIDRSLRDINLKLKTVERDQEAARREVQGALNQSPSGERRPDGERRPEQFQRQGNDRGNDRDRGRDQDRDRGRDRGRDGGDRDRGRDGRDRGRGRGRGGNDDRPQNRMGGQGPRGFEQQPPRPPLPVQQADSGNAAPLPEQPTFQPTAPQTPPAPPASPIVDFSVSMVASAPVAPSPAPAPEPQQPQGGGDVEHGRRITVKRRPLSQETGEASTQEPAADSSTPQEPAAPIDYGRRR